MVDEPKATSRRALEVLNFFIADVQNGMGPYMTLFLTSALHWNPGRIGMIMAVGGFTSIFIQIPAGALVDRLRRKRMLLVVGSLLITLACFSIEFLPYLPVILSGQILIGIAGAIFPPTLAALALGIVGRQKMNRQFGKNQAFNAAGNVFAALLFGLVGYFLGLKYMFFVLPVFCAFAIFFTLRIRQSDVDYELARGGDTENDSNNEIDRQNVEADGQRPDSLRAVFSGLKRLSQDKRVMIFLISAMLFHFSNAALVPLVTQLLAHNVNAHHAALYTTSFMIGSQLLFVLVGALAGRLAGIWGRKPLFLIAFVALILRAVLFTLNINPVYLIVVQALDGLGAGIFGLVSVLIIADLTKGTGRFNAAQGGLATAVGTGALLSNMIAGMVVKYTGYNTGFIALAVIGCAGLALFAARMPETLPSKSVEVR